MKKLLGIFTLALMLTSVAYAQAGPITVKLGWDTYQNTNDVSVSLIKVYAIQGTNAWTTNNLNATLIRSTSATNTTLTITNGLYSGYWRFVATAWATNGLESVNSNEASTNLYPGSIVNLRFVP